MTELTSLKTVHWHLLLRWFAHEGASHLLCGRQKASLEGSVPLDSQQVEHAGSLLEMEYLLKDMGPDHLQLGPSSVVEPSLLGLYFINAFPCTSYNWMYFLNSKVAPQMLG